MQFYVNTQDSGDQEGIVFLLVLMPPYNLVLLLKKHNFFQVYFEFQYSKVLVKEGKSHGLSAFNN